ncbi:MAG: hypothetical protein ACYDHD_03370 [Vulcanimicrobiaceae bacterium]
MDTGLYRYVRHPSWVP